MCTVTWSIQEDSYLLYFNRDERRSRGKALPPQAVAASGSALAYLAPVDRDAGGTWLAVNGAGITVGLLNLYQAQRLLPESQVADARRSRGELVRGLAGQPQLADVEKTLKGLPLGDFLPFTLFALALGHPLHAWAWDGHHLREIPDPRPPLVSSGVDVEGATLARTRLWQELGGAAPRAAEHEAFHRSHQPERGRLSPCMHRDDAATVSLTAVTVTPQAVAMAYADGPPCEADLAAPLSLAVCWPWPTRDQDPASGGGAA